MRTLPFAICKSLLNALCIMWWWRLESLRSSSCLCVCACGCVYVLFFFPSYSLLFSAFAFKLLSLHNHLTGHNCILCNTLSFCLYGNGSHFSSLQSSTKICWHRYIHTRTHNVSAPMWMHAELNFVYQFIPLPLKQFLFVWLLFCVRAVKMERQILAIVFFLSPRFNYLI